MPRPLRLHFPDAKYHIVSRGNGRQQVFFDRDDYERFLEQLDAAGDAALDAIFPSARDYHFSSELIQEGLLPHKVRHVYISPGFEEDDVWFDITDTIEQKIMALYEHKTQMNGVEKSQAAEFVRWIGRIMAKSRGVEYAETFKYLRLE